MLETKSSLCLPTYLDLLYVRLWGHIPHTARNFSPLQNRKVCELTAKSGGESLSGIRDQMEKRADVRIA